MRVEREQDPDVTRPELLHVVVPRAFDRVNDGPAESWSVALQGVEHAREPTSVLRRQAFEPALNIRADEDFPPTV